MQPITPPANDEERGRTVMARDDSSEGGLFLTPPRPIQPLGSDMDRTRQANAGGVKPKTVCFNMHDLKHHPHHHKLQCGHVVYTLKKEPCANNCAKFASVVERTNAVNFECPNRVCARRMHASMRLERAAFKNNRPYRKCQLSETLGDGYDSTEVRLEEARKAAQELAEEAARRSDRIERPRGRPTARERSMSPNALAAGREGRYRDRDPLVSRDGSHLGAMVRSESLRPRGDTIYMAHDDALHAGFAPAIDNPKLMKNHKPQAKTQRTEPLDWNSQNFVSKTEKHAFDWSVTPATYKALVEERGSPEPEEEEALQKTEENVIDDPEEEIVPLQGDAEERYCVCEQPADEHLVACTQCQQYYHPSCIGQATGNLFYYENDGRRNDMMIADAEYWRQHDFRCAECDSKRQTRAQMRGQARPEPKVTLADMRSSASMNHKTFQSDLGEVEKFSAQYSARMRAQVFLEWGFHHTQLAPGAHVAQKTKNHLNELANQRLAEEKAVEHKRAEALFAEIQDPSGKYLCDNCDARTKGSRQSCKVCAYDLCANCFEDPAVTHKHKCVPHSGEDASMSGTGL